MQGVITGIAHGLGIVIWAGLTAAGIGLVITQHPALFDAIRYGGAVLLLYLGIKSFTNRSAASEALSRNTSALHQSAARTGFLIAISNPKIALFFLALFSQFVRPEAGITEKIIMALTAGVIDAIWYIVVALVLSQSRLLTWLRSRALVLDRVFGVILVALAIRVAI